MENYQIYIGVVLPLIVIFIIVFKRTKKIEKPTINVDEIINLFNKDEIINIEFIRNKIVVTFKDINKFNVDLLHSTIAKGITIVGDKIKFFVSEDITENEKVYVSIKELIER